MAYDHGNPQRNTTTVLAVTVLDLNDNPPVISGGANLTTSVSEVRLYTNSRKKNVLRWNVLSQGRKRYRSCRALSPNLWEIQICWLMVKLTLMKVYLTLTGPPPHIPHLLYILLTPFPPVYWQFILRRSNIFRTFSIWSSLDDWQLHDMTKTTWTTGTLKNTLRFCWWYNALLLAS